MANLDLSKNQEPHILAANLRKAFSGIVAGNVKEQGLKAIAEHGSFKITGDLEIIEPLDKLLRTFVDQRRMKLGDKEYKPCYEVVSWDDRETSLVRIQLEMEHFADKY